MINREVKLEKDIDGIKKLVIYSDGKKDELLSDFFVSDVLDCETEEEIYSVLSGECDKREIVGDVYGVLIKKDKTVIFMEIAGENSEDESCYSIDTKQLVEVIKEWNKQVNILQEKNKKERGYFLGLGIISIVLVLILAIMLIIKIYDIYAVIPIVLAIIIGMFYGNSKKKADKEKNRK